jgi:hypothetical protein
MTAEVSRLVLAVLAYDRALSAQAEAHGEAGRMRNMGGGLSQVFTTSEELDLLYREMLRALIPFLGDAGAPKHWPPEVTQ